MNSSSIRAIRNPQFNGFSVHLRVLRVSVVNKVLELFSSLASRNSSVLVTASGLAGVSTWHRFLFLPDA